MGKKMMRLVNRRKKLFRDGDTELDLAYIMPNIIAMSFPFSGPPSLFMNNINDVSKYLDRVHGDHYLVFNLCSERAYDPAKFNGRVVRCPMDDFGPPALEQIRPFCEQADSWLQANPSNVIAVHCKAGKGRTGSMISCFMLYKRYYDNAEAAVKHFTSKRMKSDKLPMRKSQFRYVGYFCRLLREPFHYQPTTMRLGAVELEGKHLSSLGSAIVFAVTQRGGRPAYRSPIFSTSKASTGTTGNTLLLPVAAADQMLVAGDVKISFMSEGVRRRRLFSFWFNTHFVGGPAVPLPRVNDVPQAPIDDGLNFRHQTFGGNPIPYSAERQAAAGPGDGTRRPGSACLVTVVHVGPSEPPPLVDFRSGTVTRPPGGISSNQFRVLTLQSGELDPPIGPPGTGISIPDDLKVKVYLSAVV